MNEALVMVNIHLLYLSGTVRKCSPLIDVLCYTWFLLLSEPLCFGGYKISGFFVIITFKCWNRGLMRRWFITCSDSTLCHRLVAVCNLKMLYSL